jgi:uroporphyrinogen-III decarboxylase
MAMEPEATRAFFDRYADFVIEFFDKIHGLYDLNMLTLHDDWGTERDTFFSEKMMEELVFEPTKRIIDHVKALGVVFELHSCGNITRFVPYMCQMGADLLQIQRRAVDIPKLKAQYGDKIGFNVSVEGLEAGQPMETQKRLIRESVDLYGKHGGAYTSVYAADPAELWETMAELYYYSREYYDAAYGR